jgi:N-acetylglucosaminyl-diphospho-decaprenol L-rhamnosyltransferase
MNDRHGPASGQVSVVIVSFNSELVLSRAVSSLLGGTVLPRRIVVVDSGSRNGSYLDTVAAISERIEVVRLDHNAGFCRGNNIGLAHLAADDDVLLLNPDAFVGRRFLADAASVLKADPAIGAVGPKLSGADAHSGTATGLIDSAGIAQRWYGRFYDRGMGEPDHHQYDTGPEDVVALCGAAVLLRRKALEDVRVDDGLFDESYFMYKEDIDLSFRLRRAGWRTVYDPRLTVLHCRGWQRDRQAMPAWARQRSIANEWRLWRDGWTPERSRWPAVPYLALKSAAVMLGR